MQKLALIALSACFALTIAHAAPPNLVIFISDDHGYQDSAVAGATGFRTPNLSRLAADGMTFTNAFAASPSCAPSRAAFLTGMMPMRNGSMLNHQPPRDDIKKLPEYLHDLGYEVVAFGKVAHYKQGIRYGFDHVSHDTFHDHECVPAALEFLAKWNCEKPLCLFVGTNWPHVPWPEVGHRNQVGGTAQQAIELPPTHIDTPETRQWRVKYAAAVEKFDRDLGLVFDAAYKRLGKDTVFVHFSDHGAQWPFGKWNLYDAGIKVPLYVVWPDKIAPGGSSNAMISLIDVLPTLVELGGGVPPTDIDGRSFVPILRGERDDHRDHIFTTHSGDGRMNAYPIRAVRTRNWKYIRNVCPQSEHHTHIDLGDAVDGNEYWKSWERAALDSASAAAIVERYYHRPYEELYHVSDDPHEMRNLASDARYLHQLAEMRRELDAWMKSQGDRGIATETATAEAFEAK